MPAAEASVKKMGKKRKHEGESEAQTAPVKKTKHGMRMDRRRERMKEDASRPKERTDQLGEHTFRVKGKKEIRREDRKRHRKAVASGALVEVEGPEDVLPEDAVDYDTSDEERERKRLKKEAKAARKAERREKPEQNAVKAVKQRQPKPKRMAKWNVSNPVAGRFIDHDPIFVRDANGDDYLVAAVARELHVLSTETSLLVRTLPAPEGATIIGYAIESPESNLVHIADSKGGISVWDWTNDLPARPMAPSIGRLKAVAAVRLQDDDEEAEVPYIAHLDGLDIVKARDGDSYKTRNMESIHVLGKAEYIVARGPNAVVIGSKKADKSYAWVKLPLNSPSTCMDVRIISQPPSTKKASKRLPQLQLAIGNEDGQIHLWDDVSMLLSQGEQQTLPTPRILHWHRSAVSSVKFSPDGHYIISGGKETVLVIWQLQTGRKQYLPHLTSEIERITVNPQGDRYALQMGDNSIMVLSTAELKPVANFAGLQMQTARDEHAWIPTAALHPKNPKQLLLAVPPTQPKSAEEVAPRPFLQTFDLRTARHVTRQALTRNNATDFNDGPEGHAILPPDVAHLAISQDGDWLATVDEWMPPVQDVAHLASSREGNEEARLSRREVYLKIWRWDASQEIWTLSTRADSPHHRAGSRVLGAGRVLALLADPASSCFATVGEDSCVKFWKPKTRMRAGVAMKDAQDTELIEWTCKRSVQLSSNKNRADSPLETSLSSVPDATSAVAAAYSNDGSLLAVSSSTPTTLDESVPAVTFIDTASGTIKTINSGLSDGESAITAIAFLERYFITVTRKAAFIWDLVDQTLKQKIKLPNTDDGTDGFEPLLAVNEAEQTFALVTLAEKEGNKARVAIHSTRLMSRIKKMEFQTGIVKVLSGRGSGSRGFAVLFEDATVRNISLMGAGNIGNKVDLSIGSELPAALTSGRPTDKPDDDAAADSAGTLVASSAVKAEIEGLLVFETDEDDRPVVRPEQLAGIFDVGQSFAMPPVKDMFQAVVGLFGRRAVQTQQAVAAA